MHPGRERRAGAAGIPALPLTLRRAGTSAPAQLPASTCAHRARRAFGDGEKFLLTLQPQVSAPRALLEPPAATASCEPLRQALTVKKTEQSCSHGAMAVRLSSPTYSAPRLPASGQPQVGGGAGGGGGAGPINEHAPPSRILPLPSGPRPQPPLSRPGPAPLAQPPPLAPPHPVVHAPYGHTPSLHPEARSCSFFPFT